MTPTRFSFVLSIAVLAIAAITAAFNFMVDPYLVFGRERVEGFNATKPAVTTRERLMKAYQAERMAPRTVILGSSRSDVGFDPAHAVFPAENRPVYNLSLVGSDTATGLKFLQHLVALVPEQARPKTLIVGLDFEYFLFKASDAAAASKAPAPAVVVPDEVDERMAVDAFGRPNAERPTRVMKDRAMALLSLDAVIDSLSTIISSKSKVSATLEANGHLSEAVFRQNVVSDGAAALFDQKNTQTIKQFGTARHVLAEPAGAPIRGLNAVQNLLDFAKSHRMSVILLIQPAHVSRLELLAQLGYWNDYERWKRDLTAMVAGAKQGNQQVTLWDFGGYESFTREAIPAKSDRGHAMQWFWDPVHYTAALGDIMVSRMFHQSGTPAFGVELTPENISSELARTRFDREEFRMAMPGEAARLAKLACGLKPCPAY